MNTSRRNLLKFIGMGAGVAVTAPVLASVPSAPTVSAPVSQLDTLKEITDALESEDIDWDQVITPPHRFDTTNPHYVNKAHLGLGDARKLRKFAK